MKTTLLALGSLAVAFLFNNPSTAAGEDPIRKTVAKSMVLTVDPAKSNVNWTAKKVGGEHTGTVQIANGMLEIKGDKLVGGTFTTDMTSIKDTDITNEGFNAKLTNHLKSEDFFSVEKHPTSTFKITKVVPVAVARLGEPNYKITGDLTIKGTTKTVTFPATVKIAGNSAEATAKFDVNRIDYDIKFRSSLVGTAADKIIEDNFTIDLKIVAGKSDNNS